MGQRLCTAGSIKRKMVIESWKIGATSVWELQLDLVSKNKELAKKCKENMEELQLTKSKLDEEAKKCNNMEVELQAAKAELKEAKEVQKQITKSNKRLSSTLSTMGNPPKRKRQDISSLSRQQQWSRKKQLHTDLNQALLFLDQEGVSTSSITLKHDETSESEVFDLETGTYSKPETTSTNDINEAILYIKDHFGLSNSAYHELSMICQSLPSSCKLKELCKHSNSQWAIKACPGYNGVQQSLSARLKERTKHLIDNNKIHSGDVLRVKLSGDGTKICRKLNLINFTFTLLNEDTAMSPKGNHKIAIINETENFKKMSLKKIF